MKVVMVGGVAAGPKAASKIMRLQPDVDISIVDSQSGRFPECQSSGWRHCYVAIRKGNVRLYVAQ
jgi:hypothetical protein